VQVVRQLQIGLQPVLKKKLSNYFKVPKAIINVFTNDALRSGIFGGVIVTKLMLNRVQNEPSLFPALE